MVWLNFNVLIERKSRPFSLGQTETHCAAWDVMMSSYSEYKVLIWSCSDLDMPGKKNIYIYTSGSVESNKPKLRTNPNFEQTQTSNKPESLWP